MTLRKVTSWSAETADGKVYAERETASGQWWKLWRGKRLIGRFRGFRAVKEAAEAAT